MPLTSCGDIPPYSLLSTCLNTLALGIEACQFKLSSSHTLHCCCSIPTSRKVVVFRHTTPLMVTDCQTALGIGIPLLRSKSIPLHRLAIATINTSANLKTPTKIVLRRSIACSCSLIEIGSRCSVVSCRHRTCTASIYLFHAPLWLKLHKGKRCFELRYRLLGTLLLFMFSK